MFLVKVAFSLGNSQAVGGSKEYKALVVGGWEGDVVCRV